MSKSYITAYANSAFGPRSAPLGIIKVAAPPKAKPFGFGAKALGTAVKKAIEIKASPTPYVAPVKPWPLGVNNFPLCCGAEILTSFPSNYSAESESQLDKALSELKQKRRIGASFAVLAGYQFKFKPTLLKHGWISTGEFINPNHASKCEGFMFNHAYK